MSSSEQIKWQIDQVKSPNLDHAVPVVVARNVPYFADANRLQNLNVYLLRNDENLKLVDTPVSSLPESLFASRIPLVQVHVHGGAWRAPDLDSSSIEAAVAHTFNANDAVPRIHAIASLNYSLSPYPTHPSKPYDPVKDNHSDPAREAIHPVHVRDVLSGFAVLQSMGLKEGSFILTGHSCGACLVHQAILQPPSAWGLKDMQEAPRPAAWIGLNGLYDLSGLVHDLGDSHNWLSGEYKMLQDIAFGADESKWGAASPARFDPKILEERLASGKIPSLVVLHASTEDQLVPMNQRDKLRETLEKVKGLQVVVGDRSVGRHAAPWEEGYIIWDAVKDVLNLLSESG